MSWDRESSHHWHEHRHGDWNRNWHHHRHGGNWWIAPLVILGLIILTHGWILVVPLIAIAAFGFFGFLLPKMAWHMNNGGWNGGRWNSERWNNDWSKWNAGNSERGNNDWSKWKDGNWSQGDWSKWKDGSWNQERWNNDWSKWSEKRKQYFQEWREKNKQHFQNWGGDAPGWGWSDEKPKQKNSDDTEYV
jgi:hypothetical protein